MLPSKEELSELLGSLYDAAADASLWSAFLGDLSRRSGAQSSLVVMHSVGRDLYTVSSSWQVDPEALDVYQRHYGPLDLWAQRGYAKPAGYSCTSQSLCSREELEASEIYNDFSLKYGIEHGMFSVVENGSGSWASISLFRDPSRGAFEDADADILQFLSPHMQRAFKLHFRLAELKSRSDGVERALDMLSFGVIFFGEKGHIELMNRSASALISAQDGLLAIRDGLRAEIQEESDLLRKTILEAVSASIGRGLGSGGTVLVSRKAKPPLQLQISPIRNPGFSGAKPIAAVAFVKDPLRQQRLTPDSLRVVFGLTPAESRVALLLGDGLSPRKIAEMIGVSEHTVRSQIKSVFSKTGVRRQAELVRLLFGNSISMG